MTTRVLGKPRHTGWHLVHGQLAFQPPFALHFGDTALFGAAFPIDLDRARALLPGNLLRPEEIAPGRSALEVWAYDHGQVEGMAPYREIAIFLPVRYQGDPVRTGAYVLALPVTTEEARHAGVAVFGLPKYLGEIIYTEDAGCHRHAELALDGELVLALDVPCPSLPLAEKTRERGFFGRRGDTLLFGRFEVRGHVSQSFEAEAATLAFGPHPVGRLLAELGIEGGSRAHVFGEHLVATLDERPEALPSKAGASRRELPRHRGEVRAG